LHSPSLFFPCPFHHLPLCFFLIPFSLCLHPRMFEHFLRHFSVILIEVKKITVFSQLQKCTLLFLTFFCSFFARVWILIRSIDFVLFLAAKIIVESLWNVLIYCLSRIWLSFAYFFFFLLNNGNGQRKWLNRMDKYSI
jgi:hypothetical protein